MQPSAPSVPESRISDILLKQLKAVQLDVEEIALINAWRTNSVAKQRLYNQVVSGEIMSDIISVLGICQEAENEKEAVIERVIEGLIQVREERPRVKKIQLWVGISAAAIVFIVIGLFIFFNLSDRKEKTVATTETPSVTKDTTDKEPGQSGAVLTLANGKEIILDSASDGTITHQGSTEIIKLDSLVSYHHNNQTNEVLYNTLSTPRGRKFQLLLPDGSKVWMNAASSLRFPTSFTGKERLVELDGEAFFEVARNEEMPFIVKVSNQTRVQVLGTQFNIMSYKDEKEIQTTLSEGSVKVVNGSFVALLKPNQRASVSREGTGAIKVDTNVNVDEVVAWRLGLFYFDNVDLKVVMRQLGRWYDVDIEYSPDVPKISFSGRIKRESNLSEVLEVLKKNNVHFKIQGKKIIVLP